MRTQAATFHGVMSLTLVGVATGLAAVVLLAESAPLGAAYLLLVSAGLTALLYAFCAKCSCKAHCGHVWPGKLVARFKRRPAPYTRAELGTLLVVLLVLAGLPQPWLWDHTVLLIVYWALMLTGVVQIRAYVCKACTNTYCPLYAARTRPV